MEKLLKYFMDETNRRFDEGAGRFTILEQKLDGLSKFRWRVEGALFLASGIVSALISLVVVYFEFHIHN